MRRSWLAALLAVVVALSVLAVSADAQRTRDSAVMGTSQEPDLFGPFSIMVAASVVQNAMFAYASPFNDKWVRQPMMVEKLPTVKDGDWVILPGNKMRVTWRLKRGFTWHDGRPVTALDWRFTYGMLRNPQTPQVSRFILKKVDNVLVPNLTDPYTLVVQWNELFPFAGSEPFGQAYPLPQHILERPYNQDPSRLKAHPYWRAPIAAGPYRFVEWVAGSHITLEAYDKFPLNVPRVKKLTIRFILDNTVLQANQIAGTVDATDNAGFDCEAMEQIEKRNPQVVAHYREALSWERVDFNLDNEWLKDRRVRHAIAHAVDRAALAELSCSGGRQPPAHGWLAPRHPASHPNLKKYAFDQSRARQLLTEAGFTTGPDGIFRDASGKRFEMTIMSTAGSAVREQTEQVMKEQLKQVGIDLRIDNRPASVFLGPIINRRQFPHLALYGSLFSPETLPISRFHSSQIPSAANNWEGDNRAGWRNADNDRLWEQMISELDERKRIALFRRQQEIFAEDLPSLPLYFRLSRTTAHKKIANVKPTGLAGSYMLWNSYDWRWDD